MKVKITERIETEKQRVIDVEFPLYFTAFASGETWTRATFIRVDTPLTPDSTPLGCEVVIGHSYGMPNYRFTKNSFNLSSLQDSYFQESTREEFDIAAHAAIAAMQKALQ